MLAASAAPRRSGSRSPAARAARAPPPRARRARASRRRARRGPARARAPARRPRRRPPPHRRPQRGVRFERAPQQRRTSASSSAIRTRAGEGIHDQYRGRPSAPCVRGAMTAPAMGTAPRCANRRAPPRGRRSRGRRRRDARVAGAVAGDSGAPTRMPRRAMRGAFDPVGPSSRSRGPRAAVRVAGRARRRRATSSPRRRPRRGWSRPAAAAAAGWLLAPAAPADPDRRAGAPAGTRSTGGPRWRSRHSPRQAAASGADALERLTHRLRTDVMTLQARSPTPRSAGCSSPEELVALPRPSWGAPRREAQRRLTDARAVMRVLDPAARSAPEPVAEMPARRARGAPDGPPRSARPRERALTRRGLGGLRAAAGRRRAAGAPSPSTPDPAGWRVTRRRPRADHGGTPVAWTETELGALAHAGHLVAAAGGSAAATRDARGTLGIELIAPGRRRR